jgi:hypothetical protein
VATRKKIPKSDNPQTVINKSIRIIERPEINFLIEEENLIPKYSLNWIGIRRKIRELLNAPILNLKNNLTPQRKIKFQKINLWKKYCNWFNIHINKLENEEIYNISWSR